MSPLKKKLETITKDIYSNLQDSYKELANKQSLYKGEGGADYYRSQHVIIPPPAIISGKRGGPIKLIPRLGQGIDGPYIGGLSSTNRILLNKGPKPG